MATDPPHLAGEPLLLCIDDEKPVLSALRRLFRGEPYRLLTTTSPQEALAWVRSQAISLVLSDHRMPEMTGVELLREVQRISPDTSRVILTGYPDDTLIVQGMDGGIDVLISKPWNEKDLKSTIRRLLFERELRRHPELAPEDPSTSILPGWKETPPTLRRQVE